MSQLLVSTLIFALAHSVWIGGHKVLPVVLMVGENPSPHQSDEWTDVGVVPCNTRRDLHIRRVAALNGCLLHFERREGKILSGEFCAL